jgi:hypothetical protein
MTSVSEMTTDNFWASTGIFRAFRFEFGLFHFSLGYLILVLLFVSSVSYDFPCRGFVITGFRRGVGFSCQFLDFVDSFGYDFWYWFGFLSCSVT